MKTRNLLIVFFIAVFLSSCVVYSFYPLYNKEDLFANDILTGKWTDDEGTLWDFEHAYFGKKVPENIDSTSYTLFLKDKDERESEFSVHIVKLGGHYFLDFYMEEYFDDDNLDLASFHIIPVHTFAKLIVGENKLTINWFDQEWMKNLIEENKIRIHHEDNDDFILLTAKPDELQKFVTKYVNSEEAFKDGLEAVLTRQ
ncbi:hypothetical protein GM418_24135 [Maribellus comscasis]|uniref:Uncharacterized protein n=1 Tax=Maribellus comscasis TaxID=2681766 RepID=A0A6I6JUB3_9BACT|nr:hypothetical protein [Maribellus comscasis]QGY46636.1 hypothetical protein GM418_24135 [Maribellus comscasis]